MKQLLKELTALNAVAGYEYEVIRYIAEFCKQYSDDIFTDALNNLFVFKKGKKQPKMPIMVAAHTDEVGFYVKKITEDGYIKLAASGNIDARVLPGKTLDVGTDRTRGVLGIKAIHLTRPEERKAAPSLKDLSLDTGCMSKGAVEAFTYVGDMVCFHTPFEEFGDNMIAAKALDDRVGCAIMMKALATELEYDTWFVFTAQEEIGMRGATVAAKRINPGLCLVLEGTSAVDLPECTPVKRSTFIGGGGALSLMDGGTIYSADARKYAMDLAKNNDVKYQFRTSANAVTDSSRLHVTNAGSKIIGLSVPVRYIHSPACVANLDDIQQTLTLAKLIINNVEEYYNA
ncbi:MAG: M42 family peptidase [Clostridia bacterium]|nr:M42 family peptidase [Clostridia bacterium]